MIIQKAVAAYGGDLTNQGVESEGDHGSDGDTLASGPSVEHFGWDDPTERSATGGEEKIVDPRDDDETP